MKRLVLILFLFCAWSVLGATGDILSALVETNGWVLEVVVAGKNVPAAHGDYTNGNGGFSFGFGTNNSGPSNVKLTLTSKAYDATGAGTTMNRTIYGTKQLRLPYPNNTNNDISASGSDALIRVALSDFVYASDTSLSLSVAANWWSNNNSGTVTPTLASTLVWPKPIANWSCVPWQKVTNSYTLSVVAFHRSGQQLSPVKMVKFTGTDAHSHVFTNVVTAMTKTIEPLTGLAVCEYSTTVNCSTFTQGDVITNNAEVYPWMGDATQSSGDGTYTLPPYFCPIYYLCDNNGTFAPSIAVVDPGGSDANGRVTNVVDTSVAAAHYFLTLDGAAKQLAATNLALYGHNDIDGSVIVLRAATVPTAYAWAGGSSSYGTNGGKTYCEIRKYSTNLLGDVNFGAQTGNQRLGAAGSSLIFRGIMFTNASANMIFGQGNVWIDHCAFNSLGTTILVRATNAYFTKSYITNWAQGINTAGDVMNPVLVRGNLMTGFSKKLFCQTVIGNYKGGNNANTTGLCLFNGMTPGAQVSTNPIIAFNFLGFSGGSVDLCQYPIALQANGIAIVQNIFECEPTAAVALCSVANDSCVLDQHNVIIWYNTLLGERSSLGYNDSGTSPFYRFSWSVLNNVAGNWNNKDDTFGAPGSASGNRVGGWTVSYGVGFNGNASVQITNTGAAQTTFSFGMEFVGLNGYQPPTIPSAVWIPSGIPNPKTYCQWVNDASTNGTGLGSGNYRTLTVSPLSTIPTTVVPLPWDLEGNNRGLFDRPGAYCSASPKKGAGFFGQ